MSSSPIGRMALDDRGRIEPPGRERRSPSPRPGPRKASATAAGAWRTSREPWSARASRSTTALAWPSSTAASASSASAVSDGSPATRISVEEHLRRLGLPAQRPQGVEADDVARSLPDREERLLPVETRQARLLDVAVPTEALERLGRMSGASLADPVLRDRGRERAKAASAGSCARRSYARASRSAVTVAASDSTQRSARTLRISGCSASGAPNAMRCAAWCVACSTACRIPAAEPRTQSSRVWTTISTIVRDAAAFLADELRQRTVERDLARGVRAVAELVLEPLDAEAVARAVGQHARQEEAREAGGRLREHEERVAHRRRAEPLLPVEHVLAAAGRPGDGRVRAQVGAALPLGHRHADERSALLRRRPQAEVVLARREQRLPLGRERRRRRAQRGHCGVRHRDRAPVARLDLRGEHEERRPRDVRAVAAVVHEASAGPPDRQAHQVVPRRMELDLVDALAEAVVRAQLRRMLVREPPPLERRAGRAAGRTPSTAPAAQPAPSRSSASASGRFAREQVVAGERRHLVGAARREHRHPDTIRLGANGQDPRVDVSIRHRTIGTPGCPRPVSRRPRRPRVRSPGIAAPRSARARREGPDPAAPPRARRAGRPARVLLGVAAVRPRAPRRARRAHRPRTGAARRPRLEPRRTRAAARPPPRAARLLRALPPVRQLLPPAHRPAGVAASRASRASTASSARC